MLLARFLGGGVQKLGMGKGLRCALTSMTNMGSGEMEAAAVASEQGKALRSKHKIPRRRASSMLSILQSELENEAIQRRGDPSLFEDFRPGDALECMMLQCMSSTSPDPVRGIVIAKKRRGVSSSFILRDVVYGTVVEKNIPLYSPLLQSIKVLDRSAIHQGKKKGKRVRRSKLYYLRDLDDGVCRVTGDRK